MSAESNDLIGQLIEGLDPGAFVTRFVLVAEAIAPDGVRTLWTETHDGATSWDTLGLLTYATQAEQAEVALAIETDEE